MAANGTSKALTVQIGKIERQNIFARVLQKPDPFCINDHQFIKDLQQLKDLRSFLIREAVSLDGPDGKKSVGPDALSFGELNLLRYHPFGRLPTEEEWERLEFHTQVLFRLPNEAIRRKFVLGGIPWWMSGLPIIFAFLALMSLMLAIMSQQRNFFNLYSAGEAILPFYLIWLMSLGAIGSMAFIGMNALSVQDDATFDLSNTRLMVLRISLGALFGLVLTLPFGFAGFVEFISSISRVPVAGLGASGAAVGIPAAVSTITTQALMLLLPFILGFSTSLVILVLNRLVEAVQGFFGKPSDRGQATLPQGRPEARARHR